MSQMKNAAPKTIFNGINDQSRGQNTPLPETFAQHTPLMHFFSPSGPEEATYVGADFTSIYGTEALNRRGSYFNMQSMMIERLLQNGNGFYAKRLKPDDAGNPSRIIVAIDLVEDAFERKIGRMSGFDYPGDDSESAQADGETEQITGYRARIVLIEDNVSAVGTQRIVDGGIVSTLPDAEQSKIYPLFELPASFFGKGGDLKGLSIWAPTTQDVIPFDEDVVEKFVTRIFRFMFKQKNTPDSSPVTVRTKRDEEYVDVCFTPGAFSETSDIEYYAPDVLIDNYEDDGLALGIAPRFSPFSQIHVYQDNVDTVQGMIYNAEMAANPIASNVVKGPGHIDFLTGKDVAGDEHHALKLEGPIMGGINLGPDTVIYAKGGKDGTMDLATYEALVTRQTLNFGELGDQYEDINRYQFGVIYDSGLTLEGKYNMMPALAKRPDLRIVFTTNVEAEGRAPTMSEEISRSRALMARLRAFPESTLYGTEVCRAEIIQQTGRLAEGGYSKPVPQILDYLDKWASFAGAGTGILRDARHIDEHPNNLISIVNKLSVPYFNNLTRSELWDNGSTYSITFDRRSNYYPAIRSVYADDTSILLSPITVNICCHIMRIVFKTHAYFSGNARITPAQLRERVDRHIVRETNGLFGGRVEIRPETRHTEGDIERGFSWHTRVTVFGNNPQNVMTFELETRRMEDLNDG